MINFYYYYSLVTKRISKADPSLPKELRDHLEHRFPQAVLDSVTRFRNGWDHGSQQQG